MSDDDIRPPSVWSVVGMGAAIVAVVFALGWILSAIGIFSAGNAREQWRFAYDYSEDLRATARQVCDAEALLETSTGSAKVQRESQAQAIRLNYQRIAGDYNARLSDAFRAGLIRPADVPDQAPTLAAMKLQECPR